MAVKNSQRFAEIERLMGDYFGCHLAPVMGRVQRDLSNRQADEMRAYSNRPSTRSILSARTYGAVVEKHLLVGSEQALFLRDHAEHG